MAYSAEQQRKKDIAMNEAINHHQYSHVMGQRVNVDNYMHNMNKRFNPYADWEAKEKCENGRPIDDFKFNEASYKR